MRVLKRMRVRKGAPALRNVPVRPDFGDAYLALRAAAADGVPGAATAIHQLTVLGAVLPDVSGFTPAVAAAILPNPTHTRATAMTTKLKSNTPSGLAPDSKAAKLAGAARVKDAGARLSQKRYDVKRPDGNPLMFGCSPVERPSEYDNALIGVYFKSQLRRQGVAVELSDWERALLAESVTKDKWVGSLPNGDYYGGGSPGDYVPAHRVKALLDDTISGGIYLNPVVLDTAVITRPLLSGQLFPFIDVKPITGRRVQVPVMENLSVSWGTGPGTAVAPFNTASLVSPLDTAVQNVQGFIELSNDLLADSPVNIGTAVVELFGERLKSELDRVIAVGNGYNEPLGITLASGVAAVNSDNGTGGPVTVSDAESLIFSIPVQYRQQDWGPCFIGSDVAYSRFRGLPVGPGDERRVFGQGMMGTDDTQRYQLFEYKFRVANDLPNTRLAFGCLKRYRMYQRLGMEIVRESGGRTLALSNTSLVGIRARFGGRPIDTNAFAVMTDLQN
ncbi:phage major capsid protein [Urbifossiella limnaea]|uniref:Phage capsid family protein n=1 Tax=Urbifossiella limnaea TaxID=2528023 RepID=A0A517Y2P0_9BACT|nr:phage major capsid protein [Urbifossiella limnaea]QDU24037.1 Phage capsid family protein [Urbifossiella limnaea]